MIQPMDAKCPECLGTNVECPECLGTGLIQVTFAEGERFTTDCLDCGRNIGGGMMGGESPIRQLPADHPCPFCGGIARASKEGETC